MVSDKSISKEWLSFYQHWAGMRRFVLKAVKAAQYKRKDANLLTGALKSNGK